MDVKNGNADISDASLYSKAVHSVGGFSGLRLPHSAGASVNT